MDRQEEQTWLPVIAKSLAIMALHKNELGNSQMGEKAAFLESLGIPRPDVAEMLGSTAESLSVMAARAKKKKRGGKRSGRT
jgi:hypothetical protein